MQVIFQFSFEYILSTFQFLIKNQFYQKFHKIIRFFLQQKQYFLHIFNSTIFIKSLIQNDIFSNRKVIKIIKCQNIQNNIKAKVTQLNKQYTMKAFGVVSGYAVQPIQQTTYKIRHQQKLQAEAIIKMPKNVMNKVMSKPLPIEQPHVIVKPVLPNNYDPIHKLRRLPNVLKRPQPPPPPPPLIQNIPPVSPVYQANIPPSEPIPNYMQQSNVQNYYPPQNRQQFPLQPTQPVIYQQSIISEAPPQQLRLEQDYVSYQRQPLPQKYFRHLSQKSVDQSIIQPYQQEEVRLEQDRQLYQKQSLSQKYTPHRSQQPLQQFQQKPYMPQQLTLDQDQHMYQMPARSQIYHRHYSQQYMQQLQAPIQAPIQQKLQLEQEQSTYYEYIRSRQKQIEANNILRKQTYQSQKGEIAQSQKSSSNISVIQLPLFQPIQLHSNIQRAQSMPKPNQQLINPKVQDNEESDIDVIEFQKMNPLII